MATYDKANDLLSEILDAQTVVREALDTLTNCPEVNPNNYEWEDVEKLESAINEAIRALESIQL